MKKKIYIIVLLLLLVGLVWVGLKYYFLTRQLKTLHSNELILSVSNTQIKTEKKIIELSEDPKYKINIYYPYTPYDQLNLKIDKKIEDIIQEFIKVAAQNPHRLNQYYDLYITYETYFYQEIVSYVFHVMEDTGGAHPNTWLFSICYDKENNIIIDLMSLLKKHPNLLEVLSQESRTILLKNSRFNLKNDKIIQSMLQDGTKPTKDNFLHFAFTYDGLMIFFPRYQIAPYSYGEFQVIIPYEKIKFHI